MTHVDTRYISPIASCNSYASFVLSKLSKHMLCYTPISMKVASENNDT